MAPPPIRPTPFRAFNNNSNTVYLGNYQFSYISYLFKYLIAVQLFLVAGLLVSTPSLLTVITQSNSYLKEIRKEINSIDNRISRVNKQLRDVNIELDSISAILGAMEGNIALVTTAVESIRVLAASIDGQLTTYLIPIAAWEPYIIAMSTDLDVVSVSTSAIDVSLDALVLSSSAILASLDAFASDVAPAVDVITGSLALVVGDYVDPIFKLGAWKVHVVKPDPLPVEVKNTGAMPVDIRGSVQLHVDVVNEPKVNVVQPLDVVVTNDKIFVVNAPGTVLNVTSSNSVFVPFASLILEEPYSCLSPIVTDDLCASISGTGLLDYKYNFTVAVGGKYAWFSLQPDCYPVISFDNGVRPNTCQSLCFCDFYLGFIDYHL